MYFSILQQVAALETGTCLLKLRSKDSVRNASLVSTTCHEQVKYSTSAEIAAEDENWKILGVVDGIAGRDVVQISNRD